MRRGVYDVMFTLVGLVDALVYTRHVYIAPLLCVQCCSVRRVRLVVRMYAVGILLYGGRLFLYLVVFASVCIAIRVGWRLASRDRRRQLGMEFDSGLRMLEGGCYWSSPGGLPLSPLPLLRAGGVRINIRQLRKQNTNVKILSKHIRIHSLLFQRNSNCGYQVPFP